MKTVIISAVSKNGIIGLGSEIPWHVPEDFKHFKETTMGHPVIVGFNTFKTLPEKALQGRIYLVLCNRKVNDEIEKDNVHFFENLTLLLDYIKLNYLHLDETIYIAGGGTVYDLFIDSCDEAIITFVNQSIQGDNLKYFPINDLKKYYIVSELNKWLLSKNNIEYKIVEYSHI